MVPIVLYFPVTLVLVSLVAMVAMVPHLLCRPIPQAVSRLLLTFGPLGS